MKFTLAPLLLAGAIALTNAEETNPLEKVIQMVSDLQNKLIAEGAEQQKMYKDFSGFCEKRSQELHFEVKTGKAQGASLKAAIEKGVADAGALEAKISDSADSISSSESDLKAATGERNSQKKVFQALEKELVSTVDMVQRAVSIVEKEMNGGAFLQGRFATNAQSVVQAFQAMVEASSVSSSDASKLTALVQEHVGASSDDEDSDDAAGAPSAAAHENQSGGIVNVLTDLLEKAESQLSKARQEEQTAAQDYAMQKQSLDDQMSVVTKELGTAKSELAATKEKKAGNTGDLTTTTKDLDEDVTELSELHHTCLSKASDFEEETKSRNEELGALAQAKKIIAETTGGATDQAYGLVDTSFVQVASKSKSGTAGAASALRVIRRLAYSHHSAMLTQLGSRIQSTLSFGSVDGANPFKKVQSMIMDMIGSLQKQAESEAGEKEYCDKETTETKAKLDDKTDAEQSLSTKIAQKEGASAKLKGEVATLQKELAAMAQTKAEMDQMRQSENAVYKKNKPEMEQGLNGVKKALKVLKDYYSKPAFVQMEAGTKGADGIIGLLEVAESDFSKLIAEMVAEEEQAQAAYDEITNESAVAKAAKTQDVKYKNKEAAGLDKSSSELRGDRNGVADELSAVQEYDKELATRCTAKAPSYEETKKRRDAEIAGLKEALNTLEGGAMLLQEASVTHRMFRGIRRA